MNIRLHSGHLRAYQVLRGTAPLPFHRLSSLASLSHVLLPCSTCFFLHTRLRSACSSPHHGFRDVPVTVRLHSTEQRPPSTPGYVAHRAAATAEECSSDQMPKGAPQCRAPLSSVSSLTRILGLADSGGVARASSTTAFHIAQPGATPLGTGPKKGQLSCDATATGNAMRVKRLRRELSNADRGEEAAWWAALDCWKKGKSDKHFLASLWVG